MRSKKQFLWIWAGFTCSIFFVIALAFWNPHVSFLHVEPEKSVQEKVASELTLLEDLNQLVALRIKEKPNDAKLYFYDLQQIVKDNWLYIYRKGELTYWSTYYYVPSWKNIEHITTEGVISDSKGKYLVYRTSFLKDGIPYDIVSLEPLYRAYPIENNYLKSGINKNFFDTDRGRLVIYPTSSFVSIKDRSGAFLFGYALEQNNLIQKSALGLFLMGAGLIYLCWLYMGIRRWYIRRYTEYRFELKFTLLLFFCVVYKAIVYLISKYYLLEGLELFDPSQFAYSVLSPSIGDFLINAIVVLLISSFLYNQSSSFVLTKYMLHLKSVPKKYLALIFLLLCSYGLFFQVYHVVDILQRNSQAVLDITSSVDFNWLRILLLIILLLVGLSYYYLNHTLVRLAVQLLSGRKIAILAFLITLACSVYLKVESPILYLLPFIHLSLLLVVLYTGYIRVVSLMRYQAYLYFFLYAIEIAWVLSCGIQEYYVERLNRDKERYYYQLFVDNDIQAEYFLRDALANIAKDAYIKNILLSPFSDKGLIDQKVRKIYLSNYFDKFDVSIHLFDANDRNYIDTTGKNDLSKYHKSFFLDKYRTQFPNIYLVDEPSASEAKKYYCIQRISHGDRASGYIVIELKYKKVQPNSVYPELLVDRKYRKSIVEKKYNYAVYEEDKLVYSNGVLNYYSTLTKKDRDQLRNGNEGIFKGDFHHWGKVNDTGQLIVISSEADKLHVLITNFSFLFIVNVCLLLLLASVNLTLFRFSKKSVSYASRIQVYINIAFFLPLCIMSIVSLSVITNNYKDSLNKKITGTSEDISVLVSGILDQKKGKTIGWSYTQEKIADLSRYTELDLNIYTNKGVLYYSNQQDIYKKEILSRYLDPKAYSAIFEQRNQAILLNEHIGSLDFKMVYTAIRSQENGLIYGVLSIPFFESKNELEKQVIEVLNTIMNLFSFTFIALLILSYFASRYLTYPLHMITNKLGRISLTSENEPLQWSGDDEIGKLVSQYNTMLKVLEENKKILSRTEKESAWREMARQVAHEIKNPLTPMKLSLQHLIRRIEEEMDLPASQKDGLLKTIKSLLSQIDNLSDIAGSFSAFAKMPEPIMEDFDLTALIKDVSILHISSSQLHTDLQYDKPLIIKGDLGWMTNVLNNLIINAYQSIPDGRDPLVTLGYTFQGKSVLIFVRDNGSGIPEDIQQKVFQPNFSTKFAGSGIGLSLAKRGVEYMGGKIWFETMNNQGTTFYIQLPI